MDNRQQQERGEEEPDRKGERKKSEDGKAAMLLSHRAITVEYMRKNGLKVKFNHMS